MFFMKSILIMFFTSLDVKDALELHIGANNSNVDRFKRNCSSPTECSPSTGLPPLIPERTRCVLPEHPDYGRWTVFDGSHKEPGDIVPAKTILKFECDSQFKLLPDTEYSICNGQWTVLPVCKKTCPSLRSTPVMQVGCELYKTEISCTNPYDGTMARFTCASTYDDPSLINRSFRKCVNGSWDETVPECKPVSPGFREVDSRSQCVVPEHPKNGRWTTPTGQFKPGDLVNTNTILMFSCSPGYKLQPDTKVSVCITNWTTIPMCVSNSNFGAFLVLGAPPSESFQHNLVAKNFFTNG